MKKLLHITLMLGLLSPAFAQIPEIKTEACGVPVCNIAEEITALRAMNGDQRGMYAINLKNAHKDSTDTAVLENLYQLSLELQTLSLELKDEDWVLRASYDLKNTAIFNLARYSEVNSKKLVGYYKEFATATFRYNLIAHWSSQLVNIEDVNVLNELVLFAEGARDHSWSVADEDWIPRAASALISEITIKLTHLDPAHEGLYNVTLTDPSQAVGVLPFDKIAVLDSSSDKNLVVSFINSKLKVIVYSYKNAEISGNKISGTFLPSGDMANTFNLEINRSTGEVVGAIESTVHDKIEFSGKQLFSTRSIFAGKAPVEVTRKDILGSLKGVLAGVKGTLKIRSFRENVYSATFVSDNGSLVINFQGKFFPKNAVLSFTSNEKIKLTLSLRANDEGVNVWQGASFSVTTGTFSKASFKTLN